MLDSKLELVDAQMRSTSQAAVEAMLEASLGEMELQTPTLQPASSHAVLVVVVVVAIQRATVATVATVASLLLVAAAVAQQVEGLNPAQVATVPQAWQSSQPIFNQ
jgi:hypothetical protein